MTLDDEHRIDCGLKYLDQRVRVALQANFRELAQYIPFRVQWSDAWDAPWRVQIGDTEFECKEYIGFEPHQAATDFVKHGIPLCGSRLRCG